MKLVWRYRAVWINPRGGRDIRRWLRVDLKSGLHYGPARSRKPREVA